MLVFFASRNGCRVPDCNHVTEFGCSRLSLASGGSETGLFKDDGDRHEEIGFVSNGAGNGIGFGSRRGHGREACQGAAAGSALMNDYVFRGVTQSNHKPSVAAYFEPRYNINKDTQLYIGVAGESISFANRAAAEVDIYGGIRPTIGMFAFDFGVWGYLYPGGQCFGSQGLSVNGNCGGGIDFGVPGIGGLPINGNFAK